MKNASYTFFFWMYKQYKWPVSWTKTENMTEKESNILHCLWIFSVKNKIIQIRTNINTSTQSKNELVPAVTQCGIGHCKSCKCREAER